MKKNTIKFIFFIFLITMSFLYFEKNNSKNNSKNFFEEIYEKNLWGGGSGAGSEPANAKPYLSLLQQYLDLDQVHDIVDLGCGDWRLMSRMNISDKKHYYGYDVVKSVISNNTKQYKKNNIDFILIKDIKDFNHQSGDLLLVKDVLQHLSNKEVKYFLKNILPKFKLALITNDFDQVDTNKDIKTGTNRNIDLQKKPFNFSAIASNIKVLMDYPAHGIIKRVYLYTRENNN